MVNVTTTIPTVLTFDALRDTSALVELATVMLHGAPAQVAVVDGRKLAPSKVTAAGAEPVVTNAGTIWLIAGAAFGGDTEKLCDTGAAAVYALFPA